MIHYLNYPDLLQHWPRSSVGRTSVNLIWTEVVRSNLTEVKLSLALEDSQISFRIKAFYGAHFRLSRRADHVFQPVRVGDFHLHPL